MTSEGVLIEAEGFVLMPETVSVIGLGKLGLPLAACLADAGYNVIGVDVNKDLVDNVNNNICPIYESNLKELVNNISANLRATTILEMAVMESEVVFIVVPTPSTESGRFDTGYIWLVAKEIGKAIRDDSIFRIFSLVSTVLPGDTENVLIHGIEEYSGKKCTQDFGVCYSPTMIALGRVIHDLQYPDKVFIGESDPRSGKILEGIYRKLCKNSPPIVRSNIRSIELCKIASNVFITIKMSFANMMAEVCEKIPGCDVDEVTKIIGMDSRIGGKYLTGAVSYGGPCFPRDNKAFSAFAESIGIPTSLSKATDETNFLQGRRLTAKIREIFGGEKGRVSILGLSYKPDTDVVDESVSLQIANVLSHEGFDVVVYDPAGMENAKKILAGVNFAISAESCITDSDLAVVVTPWDDFREISPDIFLGNMRTPRILDCWRIYDSSLFEQAGMDYYCIGRYGY